LRLGEYGDGRVLWEEVTEAEARGTAPDAEIRSDECMRKTGHTSVGIRILHVAIFRVI